VAIQLAAGDGLLSKTTGLFASSTLYTAVFWVWQDSSVNNPDAQINLFETSNAPNTQYDGLITRNDSGLFFNVYTQSNDFFSGTGAWSGGAWMPVFRRRNGSAHSGGRIGGLTGSGTVSNTVTLQLITLMGYEGQSSRNVRAICGFKAWDAALTDDELLAEASRILPVRGANLQSFSPLVNHTQLRDVFNGVTWTGTGTLSTVDGPPIPWGAPILLVGRAAASGSTGTLAATESGSDTAALAGDVLVEGSLAATESGSDVAALIGVALVSGTLAATETGDDAAVIAGSVLAQGTLAATESGSDVAAIEGVTVNVATGSLAATESGSDTAEIVGVVLAQGTLAANDSGEDTAAITGVALVSGTLDATEAGSDTAVIAAVALVQGSLDATESGSDTAAIEGSLAVISTGSLAATESGSDTATFAGVAPVSGALAATEAANDSVAVSGVVLVTGALDATETGSDTAAFASSTPVTTAYPGPAGRATKGKRRRVIIGERLYNVLERDIPALLEAELLDRAPPTTAEVIEGPKPRRKRARKAPQPVKTVAEVREAVQQIKARIEPDNAWLAQALETVAFRVLERLQDEEDSLMLLLAA